VCDEDNIVCIIRLNQADSTGTGVNHASVLYGSTTNMWIGISGW